MMYLLWWYYEGRPSARQKRFIEGLNARIEGMKERRKILRELRKFEIQKYVPRNTVSY